MYYTEFAFQTDQLICIIHNQSFVHGIYVAVSKANSILQCSFSFFCILNKRLFRLIHRIVIQQQLILLIFLVCHGIKHLLEVLAIFLLHCRNVLHIFDILIGPVYLLPLRILFRRFESDCFLREVIHLHNTAVKRPSRSLIKATSAITIL